MDGAATNSILSFLHRGLDRLLPPLCPATGVEVEAHGTVAPEYWALLRFIRAPFCDGCGLPFPHDMGGAQGPMRCAACLEQPPHFAHARAPLVYDDASRKLVLRFKHADQTQAVRVLVPWMVAAGRAMLAGADVIVPVPLHRWRLLRRRYNQAGLLAQGVGRATGRDVCVDALERTRATAPQGHRTRKEREANVKGVFALNPKRLARIAGKNVVLVDDVLTTGATVNACADVLLAAGARQVDVLVVARVPKD